VASQATVVSNPEREATGFAPVWSSRKQPVPYVFLLCPGATAALAEQRRLLVACDSPRS
jgi:hypothetical protein